MCLAQSPPAEWLSPYVTGVLPLFPKTLARVQVATWVIEDAIRKQRLEFAARKADGSNKLGDVPASLELIAII